MDQYIQQLEYERIKQVQQQAALQQQRALFYQQSKIKIDPYIHTNFYCIIVMYYQQQQFYSTPSVIHDSIRYIIFNFSFRARLY